VSHDVMPYDPIQGQGHSHGRLVNYDTQDNV